MDQELLPLVWTDHPANPLITPPPPEFLIADPTFFTPDKSPDGQWHLFAHSLLGIHHYVCDDGVSWRKLRGRVHTGMRPFLFIDDGFYLFFEQLLTPIHSRIDVIRSDDLFRWSRAKTVLSPSLGWEGRFVRTTGNPCVVKRDGEYWLYYSANLVFLRDCGFGEPRHIGVARSRDIMGPYEKHPAPLFSPSPDTPKLNLGAGAIKVIFDDVSGGWLGFNNNIYTDTDGHSRSEIRVLSSDDGITWSETPGNPVVYPTNGWKRSLVYAMDVRPVGRDLWMYYNARDGWLIGSERIGLATCART